MYALPNWKAKAMTKLNLANLRRVAEAATPGPLAVKGNAAFIFAWNPETAQKVLNALTEARAALNAGTKDHNKRDNDDLSCYWKCLCVSCTALDALDEQFDWTEE